MSKAQPKVYIMITVDWEKDHGKWRFSKDGWDYGGVIVGSKYLEDLLDSLDIPCTWFIETHTDYPDLDLPKKFPQKILELKSRVKDEIGTHIHWGKYDHEKQCWRYPIEDTQWVDSLIRYAKEEMVNEFGINPTSFRGGALLRVPELIRLLESNGYSVDSTCSGLKWILRGITTSIAPYHPDLTNLEKQGNSKIVEFPVSLHLPALLGSGLPQRIMRLRMRFVKPCFMTMLMHIDEITDYRTGPDNKTAIDKQILNNLRRLLEAIKSRENVEFLTMRDARSLFRSSGGE